MKLTAESTVINDNKLNTNIDNAQNTADNAQSVANNAKSVADTAQDTAETALDKANGSVVTDTLHYLATSQGSGVTTSTAGWTTTVQSMTATNKYLWTYHTYTKANGSSIDTAPVITGTYGEKGDQGNKGDTGEKGDTGTGVSSVQPEYYLSTSASSLAGGSWSTSLTYVSGKYIWTRDKVTYSNNTSNYSTAIYNGALTSACANAQSALQIANDTAQYFWFTSSGSDTGAHISEKTQAQFVANPSGGNLLARSNGIAIREGLTELATFGTSMQIGESTKSHVYVDYHSLQLIDKESGAYLHVSDLRNEQGVASVQDTFVGDGSTKMYELALVPVVSSLVVKVNGSTTTAYTITQGSTYLTFTTAPASGATIVITYNTTDRGAKVFTFGNRSSGNVGAGSVSIGSLNVASGNSSVAMGTNVRATGNYSHAEGLGTTASGWASHAEGYGTASGATSHAEGSGTASGGSSHAEGYDTTASGYEAHAEGYKTIASGSYSHAEGNQTTASKNGTHAEGWDTKANETYAHAEGLHTTASGHGSHAEGQSTTASGGASHAEGQSTTASGSYSHAGGIGTIANGYAQTAIGEYNVADTTSLFIIGKGDANTRANAFAVGSDGKVYVNGSTVHGSDRRLKEHIAYLGDEAIDFIDSLKPAHYNKDGEPHVGFYAQDVEEADKWACMVGEMNGYKTLGYMELIAPLVAYVQKLEKRIEELERHNK